MRTAVLVLAAIGLASASVPAVAQSTTRIETRPFYGAIVTIEEGVRVFRPLPPHDRIIINPDGKTPLSLTVSQSHSYVYESGYVQHLGGTPIGPYAAGGTYFPNRHIRRLLPHRSISGIK